MTRTRTPLAAEKSSPETRPEAAKAKRPFPKPAIYGLGALLLISGALVARTLMSDGPGVDAATTLSSPTTGTSSSLPTSNASVTTAPVVVSAAPRTQAQNAAVQGKATGTQQPTTEKTGSSAPSTSKSSTSKSSTDTPTLTADPTTDPVVQPDPTVSNAFHFSTVAVASKAGRASRQEATSAGTGVVNVRDAGRFSASGRTPQQEVPTVQAEMLPAQALPAQALPVQAQVSQTPPVTLPTRAYVPPAYVPPAYVPPAATPLPAVQTGRALPVTVTPARTPGAQRFTQTFTAPSPASSASTRSGVASVAPGSLSVTFTPAQETYRYLGYAESDGDTLAIIHLGNRDETVAQGQLIPGTQTQLVSATPARVTLKTDRIITQIPLEAQP